MTIPERIKIRDEDGTTVEVEVDPQGEELTADELIGAAKWFQDPEQEAEEQFLRPIR